MLNASGIFSSNSIKCPRKQRTENAYTMNSLNKYTGINTENTENAEEGNSVNSVFPVFNPSYDADGNATQVQTSTGTWAVEYNAENRPVRWTNAATGTVITMSFDSQGRRTEYKSVTNGAQNTWLRFLYDGYLCVQVLYSNEPYNVFKEFVWDPTESVATRPLVFRYAPNSLNLFYAFDGNKNVSDVFYRMTSNGIGAHYDYAPFGATTRTHRDSSASFDIVALNPFRFSSEYYDSELDLVYYNFRHYSPSLGRFLSRDPIEEQGGLNLYAFVGNKPSLHTDVLGTATSLSACFTSPPAFICCLDAGILNWGTVMGRYAGKSGAKELIKLLEKWGGKIIKGGKGSHTKIVMPNKNIIIVPQNPANGTVKSILRSATKQ